VPNNQSKIVAIGLSFVVASTGCAVVLLKIRGCGEIHFDPKDLNKKNNPSLTLK
jgi:hypothetical protein